MNIEKDPKGNKCVKLKLDLNKLSTINCISDFFKITGIQEYLDKGTIYDVRQIFINNITGDTIFAYLKKNWRKNKDVKGLRKKYALNSIAFNWMNYSPISDKNIPEDEIHLYPKNRSETISNLDRWKDCCKNSNK